MIKYIVSDANIKKRTYFKYDIFSVYSLDNIFSGDIIKIYTDDKGYMLAKLLG